MNLTKIQSLQPFIDEGLHTVPLNGSRIYREGKKKHGFSFGKDWQTVHSKTLNTTPTIIGGLLTGHELVAIDCDDTATYKLFRTLDPDYTAFMDSIGKTDKDGNLIECGTILYQNTQEAPPTFRGKGDNALDYLNGETIAFLPTEGNETKTTWYHDETGYLYNHLEQKVVFKPMPETVINLLKLMKAQEEPPKRVGTTVTNHHSKGFLGKVLPNFNLSSKKYYPQLTKILTPKDYRSEKYKKQGHLHPDDIVSGQGHMYMFKIASILAGDSTVSPELFELTMEYINSLWSDPYSNTELHKLHIDPMLKGHKYWRYDEFWEDTPGFTLISKRNKSVVICFYAGNTRTYYAYDTFTEKLDDFTKKADYINFLRGVAGTINQKELDDLMEDIHTVSNPTKDFGFFNDDTDFNLFKASDALRVLNNPDTYADKYRYPAEFVAYMEHFIPSEEQRTYFLRLLRTKLTTFKYSPVIPYIIGVQGSGKNLIINVLQNIMGDPRYVRADVGGEQFLERYNDWLVNVYFVQLNELGDTVTTKQDKSKAQGKLKLYTGSEEFECRAMYGGTFTCPQTAMFIMTANHAPLTVEDTDRRLYYISTPNTFDHSPQCLASDPVAIYEAIMGQTLDIAYWLATEVENLHPSQYIRAPQGEGRNEMLFSSLNTSTKISWALENREFKLLFDWLIDPYEIFNQEVMDNKVPLEAIVKAYASHSGNEDPERTMTLALKHHRFAKRFGSYNKPYYEVPNIGAFTARFLPEDKQAEVIRL